MDLTESDHPPPCESYLQPPYIPPRPSNVLCLSCYGQSTVVSNVDVEGFVLNVDGGSMQELDYNEVRITELRINTQGESAS
jgi:hypothetical protein